MLDLEIERILDTIRDEGYSSVALQLPEGIKDRAIELADRIYLETGCEVFVLGDPCYGGCDVADEETLGLGCDALFHFGHSKISGSHKVPVHYIELQINLDPIPLLSKHLDKLPKKLGLITTLQHVEALSALKSFLEKEGFLVRVGRAKGRIKHNGQVLGCSFSTARDVAEDVDAFLYVGSGNFHPLGVALATGKKTLALDLELGELRDLEDLKESLVKKRYAWIGRARDARKFGVIVGEKAGQKRKNLAVKIKNLIENEGKKAYLIGLREISPEALLPFRNLDVFVNTACPRISIDEAQRYKKPLLTPIELEIVLEKRPWADYKLDEIT